MKKAALFFCLLVLFVAGCENEESQRLHRRDAIQREINAARSCTAKEDCLSIGSTCPFGCGLAVNGKEAPYLLQLIQAYEQDYPQNCEYKCLNYAGFDCIGGKCQAVAECREDSHCDYTLECPNKTKPTCVDDASSRTGKACACE